MEAGGGGHGGIPPIRDPPCAAGDATPSVAPNGQVLVQQHMDQGGAEITFLATSEPPVRRTVVKDIDP